MRQMVEKTLVFMLFCVLIAGRAVMQETAPIPVFLDTPNAQQSAAWQASLETAFGETPLVWVEAEEDADLILELMSAMDGEFIFLTVRQNTLLRLSPILEPAPPVAMLAADEIGVYAPQVWRLVQGDCDVPPLIVETDEGPHELPDIGIYRANCALIAAYQADETPSHDILNDLARQFYRYRGWHATDVNRAWLWHQVGQTNGAMKLLTRLVSRFRLEKEKAFWFAKRAQFHALDFEYQAALADLETAIDLDPANPLYHTRRGEVYLLLYEWDNARAAFDTAIALDPDYAPAYFQRGILLSTMGETAAANADFARYLALEPRGVWAEMARQYGGA